MKDKPKKKVRDRKKLKVNFAPQGQLVDVIEISEDEERSPYPGRVPQYFQIPEIDGNRILGSMSLLQIDPGSK